MDRKALLELLAAHADALNRGHAVDTIDWLAGYPSEMGHVASLLQVARAVKQTLVPVHPSVVFRDELRRQLAQAEIIIDENGSSRRTVWWGAAILGSALSIGGLIFWLLRRSWPPQNQSQAMTTI